ncbi:sensor histidine kinase [Microbacterium saperdae]|uniref:histidine kinase n=1 Tax=Microbacterium saperdae TaxID=69368 RepID=A0A543BCS5_9MICO|nr:histidine kinase [Microbacterium saperdae]TQL82645.1 signal transduction histidine kinase [Microbacterium saperdae]GGM41528.1 two-component sensor histidine kinase [Microbacterium saperdae]
MFRPISRTWLIVDIVGAVLGFALTTPLTFVFGTSGLSAWVPEGPLSTVAYVTVGVILWGAAAIARLSPTLALSVAWFGAVIQMGMGLPPAAYDLGIMVVLFATAAWGSRRLLWIGGVSALGGGVIGGLYFGVVWSGELLTDAASALRAALIAALLASVFVLAMVMSWGAGLLWRVILSGRETQVARAQAEMLAAEEQERVRIARDMHDIVAHSLAVVIAQADGARYAAAAQPEIAAEALGTIAQTARGALSDVRMLLTQLRHRQGDGPQPTLADLETLFAQVRQAGVEPRITVDPMPPGEPPGAIQLAVYRILQEALTNAIRHGDGAVEVHLAWLPDRVDLQVRNVIGGEAVPTAGGHGVIGMRERAQLVGGNLQAERHGEQFVVAASLPIGGSVAG